MISITGFVIDRSGYRPVWGASVEAMVAVGRDTASIGRTTSGERGRFSIELSDGQWKQFRSADPAAFVFFRVAPVGEHEPRLNTRESLRWNPRAGAEPVYLYVDSTVTRHLRGVVSRSPGEPVGGVTVVARIADTDVEGPLLGTAVTDSRGAYSIEYVPGENGGVPAESVDIQVSVFADAEQRNLLGRSDVLRAAREDAAMNVVLPLPADSLTNVNPTLTEPLSETLLQYLASKQVRTLSDLRAAGGVPVEVDMPVDAHAREIAILNSMVALSVVAVTVPTLAKFAQSGISTVTDLAMLPEADIAAVLRESRDPSSAASLRARAVFAGGTLANRVFEVRPDKSVPIGAFADLFQLTCHCDCAAATSPQAYLAHLLRFTLASIRYNGSKIDASFLQKYLKQPLRDLPATCESAERMVAQPRIAIEVLRKHLRAIGRDAAAMDSPQWYREGTYLDLLRFLDLTYDEMREIFGSGSTSWKAKFIRAKGLGIGAPSDAQIFDDLYRDLSAPVTSPAAVTEPWLQAFFGLRSTLADPLDSDEQHPRVIELRERALRVQWVQLDTSTARPLGAIPIVDPDLIDDSDIQERVPSAPSDNISEWKPIDFLVRRRAEVLVAEGLIAVGFTPTVGLTPGQQLRNLFLNLATSQAFLPPSNIPVPPFGFRVGTDNLDYSALLQIRNAADAKRDVSADLAKFQMSEADVRALVQYVEILDLNRPVTSDETFEVRRIILAHVKRVGFWPEWLNQERTNTTQGGQLALQPGMFRLRVLDTDSPDSLWRVRPRLAEADERLLWEDILRLRTRTITALTTDLDARVAAVESQFLPGLRSELIPSTGPGTIRDKLDTLTDTYQLDFESGGCQRTTRMTQAIETVQDLLFGTHNGLLNDTGWTIGTVDFEDTWRWLGTYDTWRSAILAFLYPEHLLRPSLRRDSSPGFARALEVLREGDPVGQTEAVAAYVEFAEYVNDVASLDLLAAASLPLTASGGGDARTAVYMLATTRGRGSQKIFWSVAIEQLDAAGDQSWWRQIEAMKGIDHVLGAGLCGRFVVALTTSTVAAAKSLDLWRLPLLAEDATVARLLGESPLWEGPFSLELPHKINSFDAVTVNPGSASHGPVIVIQADETTVYSRALDLEGAGWVGRFRAAPRQALWRRLGESDPYGIRPANGATFACRGNGLTDLVTQERFVLAADVDGDGADEIIAFAGSEGFWSMKEVSVGPRRTWLPLGNRTSTPRLDATLTPSLSMLFFAVSGDFDGDRTQEIVAIIDARGPAGSIYKSWLNIFCQKFSTASSTWDALGSVGDSTTGAQLLYPMPGWDPVGCIVGRFTQARRDEVLVTFHDQGTAGNVTDIVVFALVGATWTIVATTNIRSGIPGASGMSGGAVCAGSVMDTSHNQLLLQQFAANGLATGRFWTLQFIDGTWRSVGDLDAGAISGTPRLIARDFDGDGLDEVALADDSSTVRFFKMDSGAWTFAQVVPLPASVDHWAAGDFENDGAVVIVAQCTDDVHDGVLAHFDQDAIPPGEEKPDLTLGSQIPVRWIVSGRFAGGQQSAGIAALGDGCTFYIQSKSASSLLTVRPGIQRFKPSLREQYRLEESATVEFRLRSPSEIGDASKVAFQDNRTNRPRNEAYLEEGFYFLIVEISLRLQAAGAYAAALDWLQRVARLTGTRLTAQSDFLRLDASGTLPDTVGPADFDPLDAHTIARRRAGSYNRFTTTTFIRLLTDFGDAEFSLASTETLSLARELYITALALVSHHPYGTSIDGCAEAIDGVLAELASLASLIPEVREALSKINDALRLNQIIGQIREAILSDRSDQEKTEAIRSALKQETPGSKEPATIGERLDAEIQTELAVHLAVLRELKDGILGSRDLFEVRGQEGSRGRRGRYVPLPQFSFCIPPPTSLLELKRRIELSLERLRNCLDIGGNELVVTPIGTAAALSAANAASIASGLQPLPYRYQTLVERAKQLLEIARQLEATMLNYIESAERKRYDALNARRDLALSNAAERLKAVQVQQASQELGITVLQRDRSQDQVSQWSQLLRDGLNGWEVAGLAAQWSAFGIKESAAIATTIKYAASVEGWVKDVLTFGAEASSEIAKAQAEANSTFSQAASTQAEYERRAQTWAQNLGDSQRDVQIGNQQILAATTRVQGARVEQQIASLQTAFASEIATFLTTKSFANEALYEWMAGVMEGTYRFFLQQATQLARLAELQLAFERQEVPQGLIKRDYWSRIRTDSSPNVNSVSNATDSLRGLTGAANLLRDIYQLDQYAFLRNRRKQQLTETISLSRLDPLAFAEIGKFGRIVFETPMQLFDGKFPGHYLRLLRRVRLTIVALVPPNVGIRATLSNAGVSRVTIPNDGDFEQVTLQRGFEEVSFTSPVSATGQFELDAQPELLNAFEGSGVDTRWVLHIPRPANPINFDSMADILVTFEYTALSNATLRAKVIGALPQQVPGERVFSLRYEFPDAWYDLFNASPPAAPIEARFTVGRSDFPPNLDRLRMTNVVLQVRFKGAITRLDMDFLRFVPDASATTLDGGAARLDDTGIVSTRRASGAGWSAVVGGAVSVEPFGEWRLRFSQSALPQFADDEIDDVLFGISFEGRSPAWP